MPDVPVLILAAIAAVLVAAWLVARRRSRRMRRNDFDLPVSLYLAGHATSGNDATAAMHPRAGAANNSTEAFRRPGLAAGSGTTKQDSGTATAWAPPADETVELLPGRLEPVAGGKQEIRFVRQRGSSRFTLGRGRGTAHGHIQLVAPSVSRLHAYMEFEDGVWRVGRMSKTNDVVVNGTPLGAESTHRLSDGDRLELGEAVFIFRHPVAESEARDVT